MNVEQLQNEFEKLPIIEEDAPPHTWPRHRLSFRRHVRDDNPHLFLRWSTMHATMFVGSGADFTQGEVDALKPRYRDILQETHFGMPALLQVDNIVTSGNYIHQAYHLQQFEQTSGVNVGALKSIVEFGGGYGVMAILCRRLGFRGQYTIIDLPELSLIQQFYLSNTVGTHNITFIDSYRYEPLTADLFMAIYSLSEVPLLMRWRIMESIKAQYHFMAHQDFYTLPDGTEVDNREEMGKIAETYNLKHYANELMTGHWYISSRKR